MNTPKLPTTSSLVLACSLALVALPAAFAHDADAKFKAMDSDGDGRVSRAEHAAGAKQMFDQMDANHDGVVTADEMETMAAQKGAKAGHAEKSAAEKIKVIDQDGDGKVTAAEHAAGSAMMFDKMDTNRDGYLSQDEMNAGHAMMKKDK